jgi:hypothetical protein
VGWEGQEQKFVRNFLLANLKRRVMRGWGDNVKTHFYGTKWNGVKWIESSGKLL